MTTTFKKVTYQGVIIDLNYIVDDMGSTYLFLENIFQSFGSFGNNPVPEEIFNLFNENELWTYAELVDENMRYDTINGNFHLVQPIFLVNLLSRPGIDRSIPYANHIRELVEFHFADITGYGDRHFDILINGAFDDIGRVLSSKDLKGNAKSVIFFEYQKAMNNLQKIALDTKSAWISALITDISNLPFDEVYLIYDKYGTSIDKYAINIIITKLILFIHSRVSFENVPKSNPSQQLVSVASHRWPDTSPLYELARRQLTRQIPRKRKGEELDVINAKLKKITQSRLIPIPDTFNPDHIKYPSIETFDADNKGVLFDTVFRNQCIKTLLLLELSNRETMGKSHVIADLSIHS